MRDILTVSEHQEILVASKRDVENNTISNEDKELLFEVVHRDRQNKKRNIVSHNGRNKIKANAIVGTISLKTGLTLEILPKFSKNNLDKESIKKHRKMLLQILRVSHEKNFISSSSQSSKVSADEMPLIHYIIELFSEELLHTLRTGVYSTYNKKVENSPHIRGNILISKTIQNNNIDKSKVYTSYNKHSSNNHLMQVFRTLAKILLNDNNLSYKAKQTLHEVYLSLDGIDIILLKQQDFKSVTFNRLNEKFEVLFKQAEFIFNRYMPFSSHINSTPFWSILFNMDYLFEKFCAYLFRKSDLEIEAQSSIKCFENHKSSVSAKPDFIVKGNRNLFGTEIINVVDAKWKLLNSDKNLYGLDAQNFWQLFSYMNLLNHDQELHGYFIVPKNSKDFEDEIIFTPIKEGNKSITILSIDFSLSFEELIEKYRFRIIDKVLKLDIRIVEEIVVVKEEIFEDSIEIEKSSEEVFAFSFENFITELEILHNNKNILKQLSPAKKDERFRNIFYLKEIYNANSQVFKVAIKENLTKESWDLEGLAIDTIPNNIIKLKGLVRLSLKDNRIQVLPEPFFKLKHLEKLNLSKNLTKDLPNEILNLKSLKVLSIDKDIVEANLKVITELQKNNVLIKDEEDNDLSEYIDSLLKLIEIRSIEGIIDPEEVKENVHDKTMEVITFNSEDVEQYYSNNYDTIISLANYKNLPDEYKIILFFREYDDVKIKNEVRKILKSHANQELKELFELSIKSFIIDILEVNFEQISEKHISWLRGFVYCNNNSALFKIKVIIAKHTDNQELIEKLSNETNEKKIIFALLTNFNKNGKDDYVVNSAILRKIFINSINNFDYKIAIAILKRKELEYSLFYDIFKHCKDEISLTRLQNNEYFDTKITQYIEEQLISIDKKQKNIYEETKVAIDPPKITLDDYQSMNDHEKMNFLENVDFTSIDSNVMKDIIYHEKNEQIFLKIIQQKIHLRFIILIYLLNLENKIIPEKIDEIIPLEQEYIADHFIGQLNKNFNTIDREILLGYAMTAGKKFYDIREKISELTNDLDVLNELSKHRDDQKVLEIIRYKNTTTKYEYFRKKDSIYSTEILDRIARYEEYYEFENTFCLIIKLARNFSLLEETKEYLFEKYKNDKIFLEALSQNKSSRELQNKIESALHDPYNERSNNEIFNGIKLN
ncbi:MAG: hypothetical protein M0P91_00625 [Sulfuricurvum sp.]|jgi:5-methylcytosine-specific restriction endonuclease McrBC regulatory subunit McrC|uniref:5-methylcytosine restriction system specificity protein McrC n=1 Tax=Sulfuricurvum sp. TaxID=2025608 RepID=UPI0025DFE8C8|nr:hypothetical protein [Sulfuricurvum sp.]MCK9371673.1 hypothetical protein [Sulfuricurvum sp.]